MFYPYFRVMIKTDQAKMFSCLPSLFSFSPLQTNDRTRHLIWVARAVIYYGFRSASVRFIFRFRAEDQVSFWDKTSASPERSTCR